MKQQEEEEVEETFFFLRGLACARGVCVCAVERASVPSHLSRGQGR